MKPLKISRGRFVDYHCGKDDELFNPGPDGLVSAFVTYVNPDDSVNVTVFGTDGRMLARTGVPFFGIDQTLPESGRYCVWPEAIIRMEKAAERYKNVLLDQGVTLEQAAAGQLTAPSGPPQDIQGPTANDAVKTSSDETVRESPTLREPTIGDQTESGNGDPDTATEDPALSASDSGA